MSKIKKNSLSKFFKVLKRSYGSFIDDLQATKWVRGLGWFIGVIWLLSLIASLSLISLISNIRYFSTTNTCQPDKSFRLHPETFSYWSSTGYFQITLGWGHLTFTQAKAIDIVWDIIVGRGGQLLLALVSWTVFAKYLTICMEVQAVTYQAFRTIFLQSEVSIPSTYGIIRSFIWQRPLQSTIAMIFIIMTMIFILVFPTLASAMTGYDSNVDAYLPDYNGSYILFANFTKVVYVIHDGWRLNQTGEYWITVDTDRIPNLHEDGDCPLISCTAVYDVASYVRTYGLDGISNESSTIPVLPKVESSSPTYIYPNNVVQLDPPVLNISAYTTESVGTPHGVDSLLQNPPDAISRPQTWVNANESYDLTYVLKNGSCQNTGDYQWGFSFLQLLVCLILLLLWTVGIYILWLRAHFTQKLRGRDPSQNSGEHKAVLELAEAMTQELSIQHINPSLLVEKKINDRVNNEHRGGAISYVLTYPVPQTYSFRKGTANWLKREKWWLAWTVVSTFPCSTFFLLPSPYSGQLWLWSFGLPVGSILAMCIGKSNGSRIIIVLFWCALAALVINFYIVSRVV